MRIAFFSHYFSPEGNAPASRTYEHCVRWVEAGHQVTVITCAPNVPNGVVYDGYKNRLWPQREMIDGIEVIRVWTWLAANAGGMKRIMNFVSYMVSALFAFVFFCRRPKVIVATSPQFFCGWAGVIASWLKWRPLVLEIRDIWPESIVTVGAMKPGLITRVLEIMERWMYRSARVIVAVGKGYREKILEKVDIPERIHVVTNGVDLEQFQPLEKSPEFLEEQGIAGRFVCSYVGTIGMAHGLEVVLNAAQALRDQGRDDIAFLLVGDGAHRSPLEEESRRRGLQEFVAFSGRLPKEQMQMVLASSDCLLIHLKKCDLFQTVIPSKIFEAMAMSRPIIMGVAGESAEIVAQSGAGIQMEPDNTDDLVDGVIRIADDAGLRNRLSQSGRSFVAQNHTRNVLAARMLEIISSVAAGRTGRRVNPESSSPSTATEKHSQSTS